MKRGYFAIPFFILSTSVGHALFDGSGASSSSGGVSIGSSVSGGTAGSVVFLGTSGVIAQDNTNFYWNDTNNYLGIGGAPSYPFHLTSSVNGQIALFQGTNTDTTVAISAPIGSGSEILEFQQGGFENARLYYSASGGNFSMRLGATDRFSIAGASTTIISDVASGNVTLLTAGTHGVVISTKAAVSGVYTHSSGYSVVSSSAITVADNGNGGTAATYTLQPATGNADRFVFTCNDAQGCDVTIGETSAVTGQTALIVNMSANDVSISDTSGVSELAGGFSLGQYDSLTLDYVTDRWVERARSNN